MVGGAAVSWPRERLHVVVKFAKDDDDTVCGIGRQYSSIIPVVFYFPPSSFPTSDM